MEGLRDKVKEQGSIDPIWRATWILSAFAYRPNLSAIAGRLMQ
jgi:hypothetical protein